jgi:two-component system phosphate regulon sensor histidine kinase PhoR
MAMRAGVAVALRVGAAVAGAIGLGLIFGHPAWWVIGVLLALVGWHSYHVVRFERWLRGPRSRRPPDVSGIWGTIHAHVYRIRRRNRQRKKRLTRLLKEFRKSTAAMPDAGVVLNPTNEITWINAAAERLLGFSKVDRGRRIDNLIRDPNFVRYLRSHERSGAVQIDSPADPERRLAIQVIPYGEKQQLLLAKDITREQRLEKVRRDFVGNASHELRSPLTVISGYLDSLGEDADLPDSWRAPVAEMTQQAARMQRIIEDLLTLSRLEAAEPEARRDAVDVGGMLAVIRKDLLAVRPRPEDITLSLESRDGLLGCEPELYSAAYNLVSNAVKYTPEDGRVAIRWYVDETGGHLEITDTGIGIPEEAIPRLTERFYRVDKGRDRARGGTGLGLAIVKHVLNRHGARLDIVSELGSGSTFACHFPPARIHAVEAECGENDTPMAGSIGGG